MELEKLAPDTLWSYYQRGYHCLIRSGLFFRQVLRPALSHVYFQRAVPLLVEYARANRGDSDLPPGFGDQMEACPLTARDLLHLDYAICLGYAEAQGNDPTALALTPLLDWPGPGGSNGLFIAADAHGTDVVFEPDYDMDLDMELEFESAFNSGFEAKSNGEESEDGEELEESEDEGSKPPFDL